jgi:drug/metabolite transporter (DMT)-like permease
MAWVLATLIAAAAQTARNAAQSGLTRQIGTLGATQVRFLFGLPFAILFLWLITLGTGESLPRPTGISLAYTTLGAVAQVAATALMLVTMKSRSFAVSTAWIKTEPVLVALIATVTIGDPLTGPKLLAIVVATAGVLILSTRPETARGMLTDWGPTATGLLAGLLFGLAAIGFRGGIISLPEGSFLIRAATVLVVSLAIQTAVLVVWCLAFNRPALTPRSGSGASRCWQASLAPSPRSSGSSAFR